mmetsp:Transcript_67689/g.98994  ORF Transcript_67689/g.98994 Transcript_67689/m.98994 type:complete len:212 (+) Transcript_67689:292-927(+)
MVWDRPGLCWSRRVSSFSQMPPTEFCQTPTLRPPLSRSISASSRWSAASTCTKSDPWMEGQCATWTGFIATSKGPKWNDVRTRVSTCPRRKGRRCTRRSLILRCRSMMAATRIAPAISRRVTFNGCTRTLRKCLAIRAPSTIWGTRISNRLVRPRHKTSALGDQVPFMCIRRWSSSSGALTSDLDTLRNAGSPCSKRVKSANAISPTSNAP